MATAWNGDWHVFRAPGFRQMRSWPANDFFLQHRQRQNHRSVRCGENDYVHLWQPTSETRNFTECAARQSHHLSVERHRALFVLRGGYSKWDNHIQRIPRHGQNHQRTCDRSRRECAGGRQTAGDGALQWAEYREQPGRCGFSAYALVYR